MWSLFEKSFPIDMATVANHTADRKHADRALESYVCNSVMNVITTFFNSPFSDQCTTVQVCETLCSTVVLSWSWDNSTKRSHKKLIVKKIKEILCLQARQPIFVKLLQSAYRVSQCSWLDPAQRILVENCIRTLSEVGKLYVLCLKMKIVI